MEKFLFFHFLFLVSFFVPTTSNITRDQDALLAFRARITQDPTNFLAKNWNRTTHVCNWTGITCDVRSHRVTVLNVSALDLVGTIPSELGHLSSLQKIDLHQNGLLGSIPSIIFTITTLKFIDFRENKLSGPLPKEIGNLKILTELSLGSNILEGTIPKEIGNLTNLSFLSLSSNRFKGEIPHEIGNLQKLEWLDLTNNRLDGVVPSTIFNISSLRDFGLQNNSLSGNLQSASAGFQLPNLARLFLNANNFSGPIPSFIFNSSKLTLLALQTNTFSGIVPNEFGNLRDLEFLSLDDNHHLTSSSPELSFIPSLANCKSLRVLSIAFNPWNATLPNDIGNLSQSLESLFLSDSNIIGRIPEEIGNLSSLIRIALGGNDINGSIPNTLGKLKKLQGLDLRENKLEGPIPNVICRMSSLDSLDLSGNKFSGKIPECIDELTLLTDLNFGSNELTSAIPSTFWNLKKIMTVNLSYNYLTGPLSSEIGNLKAFLGIDLSMNNFSGSIPTILGTLNNLQYLFLGYNRFQGSIPDSFGGLISLQSLNLSSNHLSGAIPLSLEKLSVLKDLNFSFNNLEGEIPRGGSFGNFSAKSFEGNELLCGSPNLQLPPCKSNHHHGSRKIGLVLGIVLPLSILSAVVVILLIYRRRKRTGKAPSDVNPFAEETLKRFSYLELSRATDGFNQNNLIGKGSFGSVYKASLQNGMEVAVKVFHQQFERALKSFDVECEVMKNIRHRNLVKIISSCSNEDFRGLVLEYMTKGNLEQALCSSTDILDIFQRLNIVTDVASALEYLHFGYSCPIIHCDLKPSNVLLDDNMVARLSDFGIAKLLTGEDQSMTQTQTLATIGYMAPEYGREGRISTSGDVYSFGIMLMETFTMRKPTDDFFPGEMTLRNWVSEFLPISVMKIVDANLLSQEDVHFVAKEQCVAFIFNLALECTEESAEQRISSKEIVRRLLKIKDSLLVNIEDRRTRRTNLN